MHLEDSTTPGQHPRLLHWVVTQRDRRLGLEVGDLVTWDADRPKGARVRITRDLTLHEGVLDRLAVIGTLAPADGSHLDARQALVRQLLADRAVAEGV